MATSRDSLFRQSHCAEQYDEDRFGGRFGIVLQQREERLFLELVADSSTVLDAGTGTGKLALALGRQERSVTATDFSLEMVRIARGKATREGLTPGLAIADVQALCFKSGAFDCAVSSRVLMHLPDWRTGIRELCRVAKRSVVLDFPPRVSVAGVDAWWKRAVRGSRREFRQAYRTFGLGALRSEFGRNGFRVIEVRRGYFLPVTWHRRLDRPEWSRRLEACCRVIGLTRLFGAPVTMKAVREVG